MKSKVDTIGPIASKSLALNKFYRSFSQNKLASTVTDFIKIVTKILFVL